MKNNRCNSIFQKYYDDPKWFFDDAQTALEGLYLTLHKILERPSDISLEEIEDILANCEPYETISYYFFCILPEEQYHVSYLRLTDLIKNIYDLINSSPKIDCCAKLGKLTKLNAFYLKKSREKQALSIANFQYTQDCCKRIEVLQGKFLGNIQASEQVKIELTGQTLIYDHYKDVLTHSDSRSLREEVYLAYYNRASHGYCDNTKIIIEILSLRKTLAKIYKRNDFASFAIAKNHLNTKSQVLSFLNAIKMKALVSTKPKYKIITQFAENRDGIKELQPWDLDYYLNLYSSQGEDAMSNFTEYFEVNNTVKKVLEIFAKVFSIKFNLANGDEFLQEYIVYDTRDHVIGYLYLDLLSRKNKKSTIWTAPLASKHINTANHRRLPQALVVCNFNGFNNKNVLLSHQDLITLFHELGHAMHIIISPKDSISVGGINECQIDAAEFPSQFMEGFCWNKDTLRYLSRHYITGVPIVSSALSRFLSNNLLVKTFDDLFQLELSYFDFLLHCQEHSHVPPERLYYLVNHVINPVPCPEIRFCNSFFHSFASAYAANYHCYLVSKVISEEFFSQMISTHKLVDIGNALRRHFFETCDFTKLISHLNRPI